LDLRYHSLKKIRIIEDEACAHLGKLVPHIPGCRIVGRRIGISYLIYIHLSIEPVDGCRFGKVSIVTCFLPHIDAYQDKARKADSQSRYIYDGVELVLKKASESDLEVVVDHGWGF